MVIVLIIIGYLHSRFNLITFNPSLCSFSVVEIFIAEKKVELDNGEGQQLIAKETHPSINNDQSNHHWTHLKCNKSICKRFLRK